MQALRAGARGGSGEERPQTLPAATGSRAPRSRPRADEPPRRPTVRGLAGRPTPATPPRPRELRRPSIAERTAANLADAAPGATPGGAKPATGDAPALAAARAGARRTTRERPRHRRDRLPRLDARPAPRGGGPPPAPPAALRRAGRGAARRGGRARPRSPTRAPSARRARGVDAVYHLAGQVDFDPAEPRALYELHVEGTRRLLEAVRRGGREAGGARVRRRARSRCRARSASRPRRTTTPSPSSPAGPTTSRRSTRRRRRSGSTRETGAPGRRPEPVAPPRTGRRAPLLDRRRLQVPRAAHPRDALGRPLVRGRPRRRARLRGGALEAAAPASGTCSAART